MKLTTLPLIMILLHVASTGRAQITLKEKNASLEKVLTDIEKQTKYVFLYDPDELKMSPVTVEVKNATLQQTLEKCFKGQSIEFTVVGNNVLLKKRSGAPRGPYDLDIHGRVANSTGEPLPGVTVLNVREKKATQTDTGGAYTIRGAPGDKLRFSFVGYKQSEITIDGRQSIDVALELNGVIPDQVVVVAYGTSKKKDLTGSVSTIDVRDLDEVPFNTFDNALAGKAAGVEVVKTDGTPGGMARVRIRGASSLLGGNDPLYVIDGIPVQIRNNYIDVGYLLGSPAANLSGSLGGIGVGLSTPFVNGLNNLGTFDPDDIASITVLKDASSTAIYGSKAANGVVIITTKAGNTNTPARVTLDYYSTGTSLYKTPKLLNTSQYKQLLTEAAVNGASDDSIMGFLGYPYNPLTSAVLDSPGFFGSANTNWIKQVTRTTISNNVGVSVTGGGPTSKYFTSFSYNSTPGVIEGTDFRRIAGKLNLETRIGSKLSIATNLLLGFTDQNITDGAYAQAILARPDWTPRDAAGNFTDFSNQGPPWYGFLNPTALTTATNNARTTSLLGSISGAYTIINGLQFKTALSLNMQSYDQRNFLPSYIDVDSATNNFAIPGGIGSNANSRFADWFLENTLNYAKQFGSQHAFNAVIGQSYETTKYSWFRSTAAGYPNNTTLTSFSSASTPLSVAGEEPAGPQSYLLSFYARLNYSYLDKYLFTFTGRADGSSKFGPDNKYGYFPSGAVAWRISRENFLKNLKWLDDLKLRGSYGLTGNQNIGDQIYRTLYSPTTYSGNSALVPAQLGNPSIKWESTRETDAGLDLSALSGRLNATFDYYNRQTNDDLLSTSIAPSGTYPSLLTNSVGLRNRGVEAGIGGDLIRGKSFNWSAYITVSWNTSLVTRLPPQPSLSQLIPPSGFEIIGDSLNYYEGITTLIAGKPIGLITGDIITGIIKTPAQLEAYKKQLGPNADEYNLQIGDPMYKLNNTTASPGIESPLFAQIIANGAPKYFGGISQDLSFKKFDLQCNFTFSHGGHLLWAEHVASDEFYGAANADRSMFNRYSPSNPNGNGPRLSLDENYNVSNLDVFSSSFFKLRSLTLSYRLELKTAAVSNAQLFLSATNVFTLTKYPGSDPETLDDPYSAICGYIDTGNYPATHTVSIGFKAAF